MSSQAPHNACRRRDYPQPFASSGAAAPDSNWPRIVCLPRPVAVAVDDATDTIFCHQ
jgi:hypothetical protein